VAEEAEPPFPSLAQPEDLAHADPPGTFPAAPSPFPVPQADTSEQELTAVSATGIAVVSQLFATEAPQLFASEQPLPLPLPHPLPLPDAASAKATAAVAALAPHGLVQL